MPVSWHLHPSGICNMLLCAFTSLIPDILPHRSESAKEEEKSSSLGSVFLMVPPKHFPFQCVWQWETPPSPWHCPHIMRAGTIVTTAAQGPCTEAGARRNREHCWERMKAFFPFSLLLHHLEPTQTNKSLYLTLLDFGSTTNPLVQV